MTSETNRLKIYFLGSGKIAVPVLRALLDAPNLDVVGVGTQPDRPAGRKCRLLPTPVGEAAAAWSVAVDKFTDLNAPEALQTLRHHNPEMIVVVSYGQLLKAPILELPKYGCINVHASLLPRYRGASPIAQAILHREPATGVAFMKMARGLDTGDVYQIFERPLDGSEYADTLEIALGELAAQHAETTLRQIASGELQAHPQNEAQATVCHKIRKQAGEIDWQQDADAIEAMIRAYHPWPGAVAFAQSCRGEMRLTLLKARVHQELSGTPGQILSCDKHQLTVACGRGALEILELAPAGKGAMSAGAFLNGLRGSPPEFILREKLPQV